MAILINKCKEPPVVSMEFDVIPSRKYVPSRSDLPICRSDKTKTRVWLVQQIHVREISVAQHISY